MNNLDKQYTALLQDILDNGHQKGDRTGTGTISVFGRQIRHKMSEGFPLLTTKKIPFKLVVTELLWFLSGDTNIKYLVDNDCHIWDGDCYQAYVKKRKLAIRNEGDRSGIAIELLEKQLIYTQEEFINKIKNDKDFSDKFGELGPIYGKQWRNWTKYVEQDYEPHWEIKIDQIANVINDLKTNPDSRRIIVSAWNVGEIESAVLPPCHNFFQFYTRELSQEERYNWYINTYNKNLNRSSNQFDMDEVLNTNNIPTRSISLMFNMRSSDVFLGLPFNIASYGLLLEIVAKVVNMVPDELIFNSGDTHLYSNHIEQAKEQIGRSYTHEERTEMLKNTMGETEYKNAISNMAAFSGGLSEYYKAYKIPRRTREPFPLPKLDIHPGMLDYDLDKLEIDMFKILNYQSHPTIKAPLSN